MQWPLIIQSEPDVEVAPLGDVADTERDVVSLDNRANREVEDIELGDATDGGLVQDAELDDAAEEELVEGAGCKIELDRLDNVADKESDIEVKLEADEIEVPITVSLSSKADVGAQQNSPRCDKMIVEVTVAFWLGSVVVVHITETDSVAIVAKDVEREVDGDGQELAVGCVW